MSVLHPERCGSASGGADGKAVSRRRCLCRPVLPTGEARLFGALRRAGGYPQGIPESKAVGAAAVSQHAGASRAAGSWLHRFAGDTGGAGARLPAGGTGSDRDPAGIVPPVRRL